MDISGEYRIPASRETVWEALNDPEILKVCIEGCEELEWTGENQLRTVIRAKVGPVSARFAGTLTISDITPPESYVLSGQGQGGAAGFARGSAHITLTEDMGDTLLRYTVDAQIGGKLASVGSRLVQGVASKRADDFFESFASRLQVMVCASESRARIEEAEAETGEDFPIGKVNLPADLLLGADEDEATASSPTAPTPTGRGIPLNARTLISLAGLGAFVLIVLMIVLLA